MHFADTWYLFVLRFNKLQVYPCMYRTDQTVSVMENNCAFCEVGAESLNAISASFITVYSVTNRVHMKLSISRVTVATDDLVVYYVNTLIKIFNVGICNMHEKVLAAGRLIA